MSVMSGRARLVPETDQQRVSPRGLTDRRQNKICKYGAVLIGLSLDLLGKYEGRD